MTSIRAADAVVVERWQGIPALARLVRAASPTYRKTKVSLWCTDHVSLQDLGWSGGTRYCYSGFTIDGQHVDFRKWSIERLAGMERWANTPGYQALEGATVTIPQGHVMVRTGTFCGKDSVMAMHLNYDDLPKIIPDNANIRGQLPDAS